MKTLHHRRVLCGYPITEGLRAVGGGNARGIKQVFASPGDAVQRPAVPSSSNFFVSLSGLRQRQVARERDHAPQLGIEFFQPLEIDTRQAL